MNTTTTTAAAAAAAAVPLPLWQQCHYFLAPTTPSSMRWGVFATADFEKGDVVDVAGLTLPVEAGSNVVENSVLSDYVYGYWRISDEENGDSIHQMYSVLLGPDMFYNHHPTFSNVEFQTFGREPVLKENENPNPDSLAAAAMNPQGFVSRRNIKRGEELFSLYKHGNVDDGGKGWFESRGIAMETPPEMLKAMDADKMNKLANQYCSKIVAGVTQQEWKERVMPLWPPNSKPMEWMKDDVPWLPSLTEDMVMEQQNSSSSHNNSTPENLGWGNARAKVPIKQGERLEIGTALVMSFKRHVTNTALRPLVYAWDDLYAEQQIALKKMKQDNPKSFIVQYQGPSTNWKSVDGFVSNGIEDLALFPASGNIGMVVRRSFLSDDSTSHKIKPNCRLVIHPQMPSFGIDDENVDDIKKSPTSTTDDNDPTVGVTIELVATRDLQVGELLILDLPFYHDSTSSAITYNEFGLLYQELKRTGQVYNQDIFRTAMARRKRQKERQDAASSSSDEL